MGNGSGVERSANPLLPDDWVRQAITSDQPRPSEVVVTLTSASIARLRERDASRNQPVGAAEQTTES